MKRFGVVLAIAWLGELALGGGSLAADEVSFTLTFEDRPLPDLASFTALRAGGSAVEYELGIGLPSKIGNWFMRAIHHHRLPMKFTFAGYARRHRWHHDWSKLNGTMSAGELSGRTTEICMAIREQELKYRKQYGSSISEQEMFVGMSVDATCLPTGSPFPFELPKTRGACDSEVVWDGIFADLTAQFGTDEEKRKILEVEVEYDRAKRLSWGRSPIPNFYNAPVAARFAYRAGIGGEVVARLEVKYPGRIFASGSSGSSASQHYQDPLTLFVFGEWQKAESRGQTIKGRFKWNGSRRPWQVLVDGQSAPALEILWPSANIIRYGCATVETVKGVEVVDAETYSGLENMEMLTVKPGVRRIAPFAFCSCSSLSRVTLPDGLESIGNAAFKGCTRLPALEIPNSVTNLGAWAFRDCDHLREVKFPAGLREIPDGLFYHKYEFGDYLMKRFAVPEGVERIGKYAFCGNRGLGEVRVPKSVKEIGEYAFYNCTGLTNVVFEGVVRPRIGEGAFHGCEKLKCMEATR